MPGCAAATAARAAISVASHGEHWGVAMAVWAKDELSGTDRRNAATLALDATFGALLAAGARGDAPAAVAAAGDLLGRGVASERVYHVVARTLLGRAVGPPGGPGGYPHGLWALTAGYYLSEALPAGGRGPLLARAVGLAVAEWSAGEPVPAALAPRTSARGGQSRAALTMDDLAHLVTTRALAGDGAGAEWALARLLAGGDGGSAPGDAERHAAYAAVMRSAALAEPRGRGRGHALVAGQHALEMAELLPPSHTFLALRPAIWMAARSARGGPAVAARSESRATSAADRASAVAGASRRGESVAERLAIAAAADRPLGATPGGSGRARLDAAVLVAAHIAARASRSVGGARAGATGAWAVGAGHRALADDAARVLLAVHAARRAGDLDAAAEVVLSAVLALVDRLAARARRVGISLEPPAPARVAPGTLAAAAARVGTAQAIIVAEAALAEHEALAGRAPRTAATVLAAVGAWLGISLGR